MTDDLPARLHCAEMAAQAACERVDRAQERIRELEAELAELGALLDQMSEGDRDLIGFLVREREGIIDRMQEIEHLRGAQSDVRKAAEEVLAGARSFVSSMPYAPPEAIGWHFNVKLRDRLAALDAVLSSDPKQQEMP